MNKRQILGLTLLLIGFFSFEPLFFISFLALFPWFIGVFFLGVGSVKALCIVKPLNTKIADIIWLIIAIFAFMYITTFTYDSAILRMYPIWSLF